jgi:hypothetical protein
MPRARGQQWGELHSSILTSLATVLALPQTYDENIYIKLVSLFGVPPSDGLPAPMVPSLAKQIYAISHITARIREDVYKRLLALSGEALRSVPAESQWFMRKVAESFNVPHRRHVALAVSDESGVAESVNVPVLVQAWAKLGFQPLVFLIGPSWDAEEFELWPTPAQLVRRALKAAGARVFILPKQPAVSKHMFLAAAFAALGSDVALAGGDYVLVAAADRFPIASRYFGDSRDWARPVHVHNAFGFGWRHPCEHLSSAISFHQVIQIELDYIGASGLHSAARCMLHFACCMLHDHYMSASNSHSKAQAAGARLLVMPRLLAVA